jgi:hypothetical protein
MCSRHVEGLERKKEKKMAFNAITSIDRPSSGEILLLEASIRQI